MTNGQARNERSAEVLSLFFSLGCMQLGQASPTSSRMNDIQLSEQDYSASQSSPQASSALDELEHYGFIYKRNRDADRTKADQFFPTHLATSLTSGAPSLHSQAETGDEKKFLILETNYKIYAYTCQSFNLFDFVRPSDWICSQRAGDCHPQPFRQYQGPVPEPSRG